MYEGYSEIRFGERAIRMPTDIKEYWSEEVDCERFALVSALSQTERRSVLELYSAQHEVSVLQHPDWDQIVQINGEVRFFTYHRSGELLAYAIVRFPTRRIARIEFGPVAVTPEASLESVRRIQRGLRETSGAWYLGLQLPWQTGKKSEFVQENLQREFGVRSFDDKRNWSSSVIDTNLTDDQIKTSFSKNHRRSLKKAEKLGLTTKVFDSDEDIYTFCDIYARMYKARGESIDAVQNLRDYLNLRDFFRRAGEGFFFGVFRDDQLIGGMIIVRQGDYGFYHHSAGDPEHRNIPVQHLGVFSVLSVLRERNIRYFDFGGYNHMAVESDQVYNINRFKDGFTRQYIHYPKIMYLEFVPHSVTFLDRIGKVKDFVKRIIRR